MTGINRGRQGYLEALKVKEGSGEEGMAGEGEYGEGRGGKVGEE